MGINVDAALIVLFFMSNLLILGYDAEYQMSAISHYRDSVSFKEYLPVILKWFIGTVLRTVVLYIVSIMLSRIIPFGISPIVYGIILTIVEFYVFLKQSH